MPSLDIFSGDAFGVVSLTQAINSMPYVPGRLGQLGIFEESGITTTTVMIEEKAGTLALVPTKPRGAPGTQNKPDKRKVRSLAVPHLPLEDNIMADEIQNVRAFGSENEVETVQRMVSQRLGRMAINMDATLEYHRIGAVKGTILDSDGSSTIFNLFTEFGVSQEAEKDFDLDNAAPASGAVMKVCNAVIRLIEDNLGSSPYAGIMALCSAEFFDDLTAHKEVRETYLYQNGAALRERTARRSMYYGGITFEEYRGSVGGTAFVAADKAHLFPIGVPGLFVTHYAPADYMETVNTLGLPRYAKQAVDAKFQKYVDIEVQTNPLNLCTRPKVLIKARRT